MSRPRAQRSRKEVAAESNGAVDDATLREILAGLRAAIAGNFEFRIPEGRDGLAGEVARAYNEMAERRATLTGEIQRVARVVNREGRFTERASVPNATGSWKQTVEAVNGMIDDLARPTTEIARVIDAVAVGDL